MAITNLNLSPEDEKLVTKLETDSASTAKSKLSTDDEIGQSTEKPVSQLPDRSVKQPVDQSVDQSTNQLTGPPVDRPVAFYIPKVIHKKIDEAVLYYQQKYSKKIDRSAVVSALLGNPEIWAHDSLDQLVEKVISQLTNRLTNRLTNWLIDLSVDYSIDWRVSWLAGRSIGLLLRSIQPI